MTFSVEDRTDTPQVTAASDHAQVTGIELDEVHDFASGNIHLDGIVDFNQRIRVADGAPIMRRQKWDTLGASLYSTNFAQLVLFEKNDITLLTALKAIQHKTWYLSFLSSNPVDGKASLDIIHKTEVLTRLLNGDDICLIENCMKHTSNIPTTDKNAYP